MNTVQKGKQKVDGLLQNMRVNNIELADSNDSDPYASQQVQ